MKRAFGFLGVAFAVLCLVVNTVPASAANSSGLSITPRKNYTIQPGSSITDKLTIGNLDKVNALTINLKMIDFTFTNETGTPKLMLADDAPQTTWSLKPFTTMPSSIVVPGGQSRTVTYSIKIPKNQGAGSYYSAIRYAATGSSGNNVSLSASGVTLVFVSVPGIVNEDMKLKKLGAYQTNPEGTGGKYVFIAMDKPKEIGYTLQNNGNVAEAPVGSVTLKSMFGARTINIDNINRNSSLALLGQTRLFLTCIETQKENVVINGTRSVSTTCKTPNLIPGRYTIQLDAYYGQNGNKTHEIIETATFWYLPVWFILTVLAILVALGYAGWRVKRKFSGGGKKVIGQRRKRH